MESANNNWSSLVAHIKQSIQCTTFTLDNLMGFDIKRRRKTTDISTQMFHFFIALDSFVLFYISDSLLFWTRDKYRMLMKQIMKSGRLENINSSLWEMYDCNAAWKCQYLFEKLFRTKPNQNKTKQNKMAKKLHAKHLGWLEWRIQRGSCWKRTFRSMKHRFNTCLQWFTWW